jgi:hypothetical protein
MNRLNLNLCNVWKRCVPNALILWILMALAGHALAQPDLQVVSVQPVDSSLGVGETTNVSVTVRNNGTTVHNVQLVGYKTHDPDCSAPLPVAIFETSFQQMVAGKDYLLKFQLTAEAGDQLLYAMVKIDPDNGIPETNETNNCNFSNSIRVLYPDLIFSEAVGPTKGVLSGQPAVFNLTIENQEWSEGLGGDAAASQARSVLVNDAGQVQSTGTTNIPALSLHATAPFSVSFDTTGLALGTYYLTCEADYLNAVVEADEANNLSAGLAVRVVDTCTYVGELREPVDSVGVNDLAALVNQGPAKASSSKAGVTIQGIACWGETPPQLRVPSSALDFWLAAGSNGLVLNLEVIGQVEGVLVRAKLPSGFAFSASEALDVLNGGLSGRFENGANEFLAFSFNPESATLAGTYPVARLDAVVPFDITALTPLGTGETLDCGVELHVYFADGSIQTLQKKVPFVDLPDPQFRGYVQEFLGLDEKDPIHESHLEGITQLNVAKLGIASLAGVARFADLKILDCSRNQLAALPPLPASIQTVLAAHNQIREAAALPCQAVIQVLDLSDNPLGDLNGLLGMADGASGCAPFAAFAQVNLSANHLSQDDCPAIALIQSKVANLQYKDQHGGTLSCSGKK